MKINLTWTQVLFKLIIFSPLWAPVIPLALFWPTEDVISPFNGPLALACTLISAFLYLISHINSSIGFRYWADRWYKITVFPDADTYYNQLTYKHSILWGIVPFAGGMLLASPWGITLGYLASIAMFLTISTEIQENLPLPKWAFNEGEVHTINLDWHKIVIATCFLSATLWPLASFYFLSNRGVGSGTIALSAGITIIVTLIYYLYSLSTGEASLIDNSKKQAKEKGISEKESFRKALYKFTLLCVVIPNGLALMMQSVTGILIGYVAVILIGIVEDAWSRYNSLNA